MFRKIADRSQNKSDFLRSRDIELTTEIARLGSIVLGVNELIVAAVQPVALLKLFAQGFGQGA